ncbi:NAD(P)-dependent oxidoreductase [Methylobacterium isbiliense]|jgi:3-hydroxyisobutyrate dehydrogenase-like beta-hydroxyacid dehydrogenase|uniref:2-(Hydroxymethyl)glutarate dehydrogenase n=1 Tax=Methylobacterium isbiliense TaxID=315478 RepID=A0ABQ4S6N1_9HYPH|nr:NAD(P)-dependent oxidoreductase [Methylobacterium isbiliense]MDN3624952.1 NAD(P)-dependent oxidoreductase [Methylobacterium isbiliense]GJD98828.1 2-(hydroxymethyl)glutarate dehydrogenase [Methylobacterium isbiliense]
MAKVAFLGLGVMGAPMARHLAAKGHEVTVYNRTAEKAQAWVAAHGGRSAATPAEAAAGQEIVFACVGNDDDLRQVALGPDGAFPAMRAGAVFVDHTTASADVARELAAASSERGFDFVDAPVSGGQAGAENGVLTVMCGGDPEIYARVEPVIMAFARSCRLMGPAGSGQLTKMVNQICIAGLVQGLAEGIHFGKRAGLDIEAVLDVIAKGAAGSWQMENRGRTMNQNRFDFGFAVDWMRKDLAIVLAEARHNKALLPVTALVDQFYAEVQTLGGGRWDTSSLIARLEK